MGGSTLEERGKKNSGIPGSHSFEWHEFLCGQINQAQSSSSAGWVKHSHSRGAQERSVISAQSLSDAANDWEKLKRKISI